MKNGQHFESEEHRQGSNSRNNHIRMPSLPSNIKGSIGNQNMGHIGNNGQKRGVMHPGMPLNIAANDIKFSGSYNQIRKFGGNAPQSIGMNG
jgi:hypothetical protein